MLAHTYFHLVDAIAVACGDEELSKIRDQVATTAMHPFERRALERQLRDRELWLQLDLEL